MKIVKKPWFIPIMLTLVILIAGQFYTKNLVSKAETMTEKEIRTQLEKMYEGEVERISLNGSIYEAELSRDNGVYAVEVNAETGKVLSLFQTKEIIKETPIASAQEVDDEKVELDTTTTKETVENPASQPSNDTTKTENNLSEPKTTIPPKTQAGTTGQKNTESSSKTTTVPAKQHPKTVLISSSQAEKIALGQLKGEVEDVEFIKTSDGGYYLVEIDGDEDGDHDEAVFQIHAISGKVLAVTWDD